MGIGNLVEDFGKKLGLPYCPDTRLRSYVPKDTDYPYYPDIGFPPSLEDASQHIQKVDEINLKNLSPGTIFGWNSFSERENDFIAHPDSIFTAEVVQARDGKYLRFWRTDIHDFFNPERLQGMKGQGIFVKMDDFLNDQEIWGTSDGIYRIYGNGKPTVFQMPWFEEGSGGRIKKPAAEKAFSGAPGTLFLVETIKQN